MCGAGKFQDVAGATTCEDCPSGKAQPDTGESKCDECQVTLIPLDHDPSISETRTALSLAPQSHTDGEIHDE